MKDDYSDIIDMPFHEPDPQKHPRMTRAARAAQFSSFAALTGYEDIVEQTQVDVRNAVLSETVFEEIEDI